MLFSMISLVEVAFYLVVSVSASKCVTQSTGNLWTAPYHNTTTGKSQSMAARVSNGMHMRPLYPRLLCTVVSKPYTWNTQNYVGFYNNGPREYIYVEWQVGRIDSDIISVLRRVVMLLIILQTCSPNYFNSTDPNDAREEGVYQDHWFLTGHILTRRIFQGDSTYRRPNLALPSW